MRNKPSRVNRAMRRDWECQQAALTMPMDACSIQQIICAHHIQDRGECAAAFLANDIRLHFFRQQRRCPGSVRYPRQTKIERKHYVHPE